MTVQNKGTYCDKLQLYVPHDKKELIQKMKQLLKADNQSLSQFCLQAIEKYYLAHEPGNPQQRLDTIHKLGKAYRADKCFTDGCKGKPAFHVTDNQNRTYLLCKACLEHCMVHLKGWRKL